MPHVTDPADPRLADYRGLRDPAARVAYERAHGVFVVEGALAIERLLASSYDVRSVLVTPAMRDRLGLDDGEAYVASREVIAAVAGFDVHRGALAVAARAPLPAAADLVGGATTVLLLERLNDHENVGVLFRVARALGADAVLLDPETCDPLYRRAVRVSLGHVLHVPFTRVDSTREGLDLLRANGFTTYALTPAGDVSVADVPRAARCALLLGAEGPGLRPETMQAADYRVGIPMRADVDSLNVATAAAIALHRLADPAG
ncbi:MAG TPA: RNA methyltransferase [Frankiaceae bacterium]|nr:RNA methyltransferase [Frankiaceae bacterium]